MEYNLTVLNREWAEEIFEKIQNKIKFGDCPPC
jgi:hypothetical protein